MNANGLPSKNSVNPKGNIRWKSAWKPSRNTCRKIFSASSLSKTVPKWRFGRFAKDLFNRSWIVRRTSATDFSRLVFSGPQLRLRLELPPTTNSRGGAWQTGLFQGRGCGGLGRATARRHAVSILHRRPSLSPRSLTCPAPPTEPWRASPEYSSAYITCCSDNFRWRKGCTPPCGHRPRSETSAR